MRSTILVTFVIAIMAFCSAEATACPSCGFDDMKRQKGGAGLADGFVVSMVGMASMPFLVVGSVAGYLIYSNRRRREEVVNDEL